MPLMAGCICFFTSNAARALACGVGLFAAHSFQREDDGRGVGAPVAVSAVFCCVVILIILIPVIVIARDGRCVATHAPAWHNRTRLSCDPLGAGVGEMTLVHRVGLPRHRRERGVLTFGLFVRRS